jgi:nucleoside-specific outer membrane channel protein Tsx
LFIVLAKIVNKAKIYKCSTLELLASKLLLSGKELSSTFALTINQTANYSHFQITWGSGAMNYKYFLFLLCISGQVFSAQWSSTEFQFQYGELKTPSFVGSETNSSNTRIFTLQNASGWDYGDTFFFIDYLNDDNNDGFNQSDYYAEIYFNFSLGKMLSKDMKFGAIKDVGLLFGINAAGDANVVKYLPGIRLSWDLPGFAFLNTDFMAYLDSSEGVSSGGAPSEDNGFLIDVNWAYPFALGSQLFSIEGHMEYASERTNEFGQTVEHWILAQPQFRWDIGNAMMNKKDQLFVGIEYQYWQNKLGDKDTDESVAQFLVVWRF